MKHTKTFYNLGDWIIFVYTYRYTSHVSCISIFYDYFGFLRKANLTFQMSQVSSVSQNSILCFADVRHTNDCENKKNELEFATIALCKLTLKIVYKKFENNTFA